MKKKKAPVCPPPYMYEGHDWKLDGERWVCVRCNATVGVQKTQ